MQQKDVKTVAAHISMKLLIIDSSANAAAIPNRTQKDSEYPRNEEVSCIAELPQTERSACILDGTVSLYTKEQRHLFDGHGGRVNDGSIRGRTSRAPGLASTVIVSGETI